VVVGVPDDQPAGSERQNRDMPVNFVPVECGLVMDNEVHKLLVADGLHDRVLDQLREVPARVDLRPQLAPRRSQPHEGILLCWSHSPAPLSFPSSSPGSSAWACYSVLV